ncbi:hypothetical protein Rrhod_1684 [Rhodococcus rhodnii LMG 5362]|uniref:Class I SAM-dependent methyltransferase n=2 Tax=Rhodococcus rhodnii TaxID=38312 RepID=R7WNT1_9NOCA|nr:hypothetical protein Rrhod_1684 [Rhodococcus rhodnii LMG 5362]
MAELHAEVRELRTELAQTRDLVDERTHALDTLTREIDHRRRRDIAVAAETDALTDTARFVTEHLPLAQRRPDPRATLDYALSQVDRGLGGLALEFGVATGATLTAIADALRGAVTVAGFDVFSGLPETWRTGFPAGEFAQDTIPDVDGADVVVGLFEDTLPGYLAEHPGPVAFAHLDADLYSSTATALTLIEPRVVAGTVLVFDEFFNYPGWREHEYRAWQEFADRTGCEYEYLCYTLDHEQLAVRVTALPSRE